MSSGEEYTVAIDLDKIPIEPKTTILEDQDFKQKMGMVTTVAVELYRVLAASFLILFVPQLCEDHVCSFEENAQTGIDPLYNAGFTMNCITLIAFVFMYYVESSRERKLIAYMDVNPKEPCDNQSVGHLLVSLPKNKRDAILFYDKLYYKTGYLSLICFIINTILSGFVVYKYYLDDQTTTTFITSVLFMIQKMADVYATVNTESNVFYSAYLRGKIQYNDVDKDKKISELEMPAV
jgi:hypothetical protein